MQALGKCSLVHLVLDVSPSMTERVVWQVLQSDRMRKDEVFSNIVSQACGGSRNRVDADKVCLAYSSLVSMLEYLYLGREVLRRPSLMRRLFSISLLGLPPGDERIRATPPRPILSVVDAYSAARESGAGPLKAAEKVLGITLPWLRMVSERDARYTDGACAGEGLRWALDEAKKQCSKIGRVLVICFSDCCVNDFGGRVEEERLDLKTVAEETRALMEKAAGDYGAEALGVVVVLYGNPALAEVEEGVCPIRAARIADRITALEQSFREVAEYLKSAPGLAADPSWARISDDDGVPLADYAIRRASRPEALAHMLLVATTTTTA